MITVKLRGGREICNEIQSALVLGDPWGCNWCIRFKYLHYSHLLLLVSRVPCSFLVQAFWSVLHFLFPSEIRIPWNKVAGLGRMPRWYYCQANSA